MAMIDIGEAARIAGGTRSISPARFFCLFRIRPKIDFLFHALLSFAGYVILAILD